MANGVTDHTQKKFSVLEVTDLSISGDFETNDLRDSGANVLLTSTGSGHTQTTPSGSFTRYATISQIVAANCSLTIHEGSGYAQTAGDDTIWCFLDSILPYKELNGTVMIERITIWINSGNIGDYITQVNLNENDLDTGLAATTVWQDFDDYGKNNGIEAVPYTINYTTEENKVYGLSIYCKAVAALLVYGIEVQWRLV